MQLLHQSTINLMQFPKCTADLHTDQMSYLELLTKLLVTYFHVFFIFGTNLIQSPIDSKYLLKSYKIVSMIVI